MHRNPSRKGVVYESVDEPALAAPDIPECFSPGDEEKGVKPKPLHLLDDRNTGKLCVTGPYLRLPC